MTDSRQTTMPIYAIVGKERFLCQQALAEVLARFDEEEAAGRIRASGTSAELAEVLDDVRTMSLLGGRRIVVVDEADAFVSAHRAALERYAADPAPSGCLILLCSSMPSNTRLYKAVKKSGAVIACEPPKGAALAAWLRTRASSIYGKKLEPSGAGLLVELLGNGPGQLDTELGKLAAYVEPRKQITADDVSALTGHSREEAVFAVTDAIASGQADEALRCWQQVLATDRAAPGRALGGLAWSVRRLLEAKREHDRGVSVGELSRRFYTDPRKLEQRLGRASVESLESQMRDLLKADIAIKTGAASLEASVEKFIIIHSGDDATAQRPSLSAMAS